MSKQILFDQTVREKLLKGLTKVVDAISPKIGFSQRAQDHYFFIKQIELDDPFENMGAAFAKALAKKIMEETNDGIITGMVFLKEFVKAGMRCIAKGANPLSIKTGMDKGLDAILKQIDQSTIKVKQVSDLHKIISINCNLEIIEIINALQDVGLSAPILIEEKPTSETTINIIEGVQLFFSYISPYFYTDLEKMSIEMENASILIINKKISSIYELFPVLQSIKSNELLIIAKDIEKDVLSTLVINKLYKHLKIVAIKEPKLEKILKNLAAFIGSNSTNEFYLGRAKKVLITNKQAILINDLKDNTQPIVLIEVGALTLSERKLKKQRLEEYMHFIRSAIEFGVVLGGGSCLVFASQFLDQLNFSEEENFGLEILKRGCLAPFKQIVLKSKSNPKQILAKVQEKGPFYGFNILSQEIEDLLEAKIVDPANVVKNSLIHAVSTAGLILLSEVLIVDEK